MSVTPTTLLSVQTVVLLGLSLLLLYPVYAYARNVMHTGGIVALAAALFLFTASSVVKHLGYALLGEAIHLVTDLCLLAAVWLFAREFVRTGGEFDGASAAAGTSAPDDAASRRGGFAEGDAPTDGGDGRD